MSERERIEVWDCDCGIVNDVVDEECIVCEQPRQTIITPPTRDWKPVVGEKVLVVVEVEHSLAVDNDDEWWVTHSDGTTVLVPLSSIRPMRKEGE